MKKSLISRIQLANKLEQKIIENAGEITEDVETMLQVNQNLIARKVDSYAFIMESLKDRARYWDEKAALISKYARTCSEVVTRLRANLKAVMVLENEKEIKGDDYRFVLAEMHYTLNIDEKELPDEYYKIEVTRSVDKEKIRQAIKEGVEIPGVNKVDVFSLRTYPNHSSPKPKKKAQRKIK